MKNIIIKTVLLVLLVLSTGCSEEFLEVENKNNLTDGSFYQTQNDFLLALNSCYSPMADRGLYGLNLQLAAGTWEDRTLFETTNRDNLSIISSSSFECRMTWQALYFGVYRTTAFIRKLEEQTDIEGFTQDERDLYEAQARALRAMYYFDLVSFFHTPIYYDEENFPVDYTENFTNGEPIQFWDQIETDLAFAIAHLPKKSEYNDEDLGRVTTGSAGALLGKALLYKHYHYHVAGGTEGGAEDQEDLANARDAFLEVMSSGDYELVMPLSPKTRKDYMMALLSNTSYLDLPSENNTYKSENNVESIWEVQFSNDLIQSGWLPGWQWSGSLNTQYFSPHSNSYKNHEVHPDWFFACDSVGTPVGFERDPRAYASCYLDGDTMHFDPTNTYYKKFNSYINTKRIAQSRGLAHADQPSISFGMKKYYFPIYDEAGTASPNNDPTNRKVIRYADVLLMYAEVMYLSGDDGTGLNALNEVRARVDMAPVPALTTDAIIHERDIELAFESHRWNDLVRWSLDPAWGIDWDALLGPGIFITGKHEYYPIPITEIDVNSGALKQNPGW